MTSKIISMPLLKRFKEGDSQELDFKARLMTSKVVIELTRNKEIDEELERLALFCLRRFNNDLS